MKKSLSIPTCGTISSFPKSPTAGWLFFSAVNTQVCTMPLLAVHPLPHQPNTGLTEGKNKIWLPSKERGFKLNFWVGITWKKYPFKRIWWQEEKKIICQSSTRNFPQLDRDNIYSEPSRRSPLWNPLFLPSNPALCPSISMPHFPLLSKCCFFVKIRKNLSPLNSLSHCSC